jgi:hypothetical protein
LAVDRRAAIRWEHVTSWGTTVALHPLIAERRAAPVRPIVRTAEPHISSRSRYACTPWFYLKKMYAVVRGEVKLNLHAGLYAGCRARPVRRAIRGVESDLYAERRTEPVCQSELGLLGG